MMRSYEDRWNWLRAQLEDDADTLLAIIASPDRIRAQHASSTLTGVQVALRHMDDADRNGPVEPL